MVTWLALLVVIAAVGFAGWYVWQNNKEDQKAEQQTPASAPTPAPVSPKTFSFETPKKGAHFESSTPAHEAIIAAVPVDVVINFNFDLADNSTIQITKDDKDYSTGNTSIDSNKLALRRQMDKGAPDGLYTVKYNGCWPDRTCHDGHFQFAIDRTLVNSYQDKRNQKTVVVRMSQIMFNPKNLRLSPGTTVTWINDDDMVHYVNTDSHPAHTQVPALNSKALSKGQTYNFTFTNTGAYLYHCSAHEASMKAAIVVE